MCLTFSGFCEMNWSQVITAGSGCLNLISLYHKYIHLTCWEALKSAIYSALVMDRATVAWDLEFQEMGDPDTVKM